ncbi:MAG: energy transducer TonB [Nitrosomonas sp.]|nr:energy transducer TonB [Nitrosomonas sp.]
MGIFKTNHQPVITITSLLSLVAVLGVHAALIYGLMQHRFNVVETSAVTLYAEFISPPVQADIPEAPKVDLQPEPKPPQVKPQPPVVQEKPKPRRQLVAKAPATTQQDVVAPVMPVEESPPAPAETVPQTVAAARPAQMPAGPVTLSTELSVSCPEMARPPYPALSRRLGEEGKLTLQVELDESGKITQTKIVKSSGYSRLDSAAVATVKTWRCRPATRDGQPVRTVALQPFNFVIQGE